MSTGRAALMAEKRDRKLWGLLWGLGVWQAYSRLLPDSAARNLFNGLSNTAQPRATLHNAVGLILSPLRLPVSPPGRGKMRGLNLDYRGAASGTTMMLRGEPSTPMSFHVPAAAFRGAYTLTSAFTPFAARWSLILSTSAALRFLNRSPAT